MKWIEKFFIGYLIGVGVHFFESPFFFLCVCICSFVWTRGRDRCADVVLCILLGITLKNGSYSMLNLEGFGSFLLLHLQDVARIVIIKCREDVDHQAF